MNDSRPARPRRHWCRFRLRTLLVLVVLCAVACNWFAVKLRSARLRQAAVARVVEGGGAVYYYDPGSDRTVPEAGLPEPSWLRRSLGDDFFFDVSDVSFSAPGSFAGGSPRRVEVRFGDGDMVHVGRLTGLERLAFDDTQITDAGLVHLKGLTHLLVLNLGGTQISDAGLEHLAGLTRLRRLWLQATGISDVGLEHLKGLTNLQWLCLSDTQVTDAGLEHLEGLKSLRGLNLRRTMRVTDEGVKKLQQALPDCEILH